MTNNAASETSFANIQALAQVNCVCDLSAFYGLVRVTGDDAQTFLQGQFSNDVKLIDKHTSQLNSYNSPKGRMLAMLRLCAIENDFVMRLPREILAPTLKRLRMFVMRSKVTLEDCDSSLSLLGVAGDNAQTRLALELGDLPATVNSVKQCKNLTVIRVAGIVPQFEIIGETGHIRALAETLASELQSVDINTWQLLAIAAAIPEVTAGTVEEFVPQMVNLQLVGGVSFTKGCYPGQEIVARMHYLGKLKKRMYILQFNAASAPTPNTALYESATDNEQAVGNIVLAQKLNPQTVIAIAVAQIDSVENKMLKVGSAQGPTIETLPLPYAFNDEDTKQKRKL